MQAWRRDPFRANTVQIGPATVCVSFVPLRRNDVLLGPRARWTLRAMRGGMIGEAAIGCDPPHPPPSSCKATSPTKHACTRLVMRLPFRWSPPLEGEARPAQRRASLNWPWQCGAACRGRVPASVPGALRLIRSAVYRVGRACAVVNSWLRFNRDFEA